MALDVLELIERKRDGGALSADEISALIVAYTADQVADEQMSALLMAGVIRGFDDDEAIALTDAFVRSGDVVDLSALSGPTVDKHSTGGVGDSTTFVVAPLLAACGLQVAKLSGRGLGHTGGTLDKLEAIPGLRVDLTAEQVVQQVQHHGLAVAAATARLVPADKRMYALRDVTGTVASRALIAASVMSKKIASGAQHIVLDVKTGDGAFLATEEDALALARLCIRLGEAAGRQVTALVTDMSQPLGPAIGNALEVAAAIDVLCGSGGDRLREVSLALATAGLVSTGVEKREARAKLETSLASGAALGKFKEMVEAQGGVGDVVDAPWEHLPQADVVLAWSPQAGTVTAIACRLLGELAARLGAGRAVPGADVDPAVGLEVLVGLGDRVVDGQEVVRIHARTAEDAEAVLARLGEAVTIGEGEAVVPALIRAELTGGGN